MTCPICGELYASDSAPRVLHRGHTFCDNCLANCLFNWQLYCPNRRHTTTPVDQANHYSGGTTVNAALFNLLNSSA